MSLRRALAAPALALALLAAPSLALAEEGVDSAAEEATVVVTEEAEGAEETAEEVTADAAEETAEVVIDRADFYLPSEEDERSGATLLSASFTLVQISDEMKYFAKYESHGGYDQGFSSGDGYMALGYYQFDRRYSLIDFMEYCLSYDAEKYAMFAAVVARASEVEDSSVAMYEDGALTELGALVENAWHAAYAADPDEFALLQDNYSYDNYYLPTANYLAKQGISMEGRADCVKGLVWSMTDLFGTGGVRYFLDKAELSNDLSDREFVNRLCDAVVNYVAERYPSQTQYHQGWINRYENERQDCLAMLSPFDDVSTSAWYYDAVLWAYEQGYMTGYGDGTFGPTDVISRAQMVQLLWNYAGRPGTAVSELPADCDGEAFYAEALSWALGEGYITGYGNGDFGPADSLTREQAVLILWRYFGSPVVDEDLSAYPDADSVSDVAREAMAWAVSEGIITGSGGKLLPQGTCTRAELATMLMRL